LQRQAVKKMSGGTIWLSTGTLRREASGALKVHRSLGVPNAGAGDDRKNPVGPVAMFKPGFRLGARAEMM